LELLEAGRILFPIPESILDLALQKMPTNSPQERNSGKERNNQMKNQQLIIGICIGFIAGCILAMICINVMASLN